MGYWTRFNPAVIFLTFISNAFCVMVRKTPSFVQSSLINEWTPTEERHFLRYTTLTRPCLFQDQQSAEAFMGLLNAIFLFISVPGNIISGLIADRLEHRLVLTAGMTLSAFVMFIFGFVLDWTGGYSKAAYIILMTLNALFQSSCWPSVVAVIANWVDKRSSAYVFGIWSTCPCIGEIVGALIVSSVLGYGYEYAFIVTSSVLFASGVLVFFGLVSSPRDVSLTMPDDDVADRNDMKNSGKDDICSNGERSVLLGKKTFFRGRNKQHTYHSFFNHTTKACPTEFTPTDENSDVFSYTAESQDNAEQLAIKSLKSSTCNTHAEQSCKDGFQAETDVDTEHPHKYIHVEGQQSVDNRYKKYISSADSDNESDLNMKLPDVENLTVTDISQKPTLNESSQAHELSQRDVTKDRHSDVTFNRTFSTTREQIITVEQHTTIEHQTAVKQKSQGGIYSRPKAMSFFQAVLLPGVIPYSLCFAFITFNRYMLFFWLPFFLTSFYRWSESTADRLSLWFDVGGIVGSIVMAFVMGRSNKSALIFAPTLAVNIPLIYIYYNVGHNMVANALMLFCIGGLIISISNILSSTVAVDLSRHVEEEVTSTVTGFIQGTGLLGASVGQIAIPHIKAAFGWPSIFYCLMLSTFLGLVSILHPAVSEIRCMTKMRKQ